MFSTSEVFANPLLFPEMGIAVEDELGETEMAADKDECGQDQFHQNHHIWDDAGRS